MKVYMGKIMKEMNNQSHEPRYNNYMIWFRPWDRCSMNVFPPLVEGVYVNLTLLLIKVKPLMRTQWELLLMTASTTSKILVGVMDEGAVPIVAKAQLHIFYSMGSWSWFWPPCALQRPICA